MQRLAVLVDHIDVAGGLEVAFGVDFQTMGLDALAPHSKRRRLCRRCCRLRLLLPDASCDGGLIRETLSNRSAFR